MMKNGLLLRVRFIIEGFLVGDLSKAMHGLSKQLKMDIHDVMSSSIFNVSKSAINMSPVDTGRFKANWYASIAKPIKKTAKTNRRKPLVTLSEKIEGAISAQEKFFLSNNLSYAQSLEYGKSNQAPEGVLRVSVLREIKNLTKLLNSDKIVTGGSGKRWS